jgi:tetratricopeptide (TPR) repeat protein
VKRFVFLLLVWTVVEGSLWAGNRNQKERQAMALDGESRFQKQEYALAVPALEKAVEPGASRRDLLRWLPILGACHEALGHYQKALAVYQEADHLAPGDTGRRLDLARVYARVDLDDRARELYEDVLRRRPAQGDVLFALGRLCLKMDDLKAAREYARRYAAVDARDPAGQDLLARVDEAEGLWADAARRREAGLPPAPPAEAWTAIGRLWARSDQLDLAQAAYARAPATGADSAETLFQQGVLAWRRGDDKGAGELWRKVLALSPANWPAAFFLNLTSPRPGETARLAAGAPTPELRDLIKP